MSGNSARHATLERPTIQELQKTPIGVRGLDEVTGGGLPKGRSTLVCGGAGSGKTLLAMEFLTRGATQFDEPGVFVSFEESADELATNFVSLGHNLNALVKQKRLVLDFIRVEPDEMKETGAYNLDGLFIRLEHAIDSIGAKRVTLDSIETLFSGMVDTAILRAELHRLFQWLKTRGVTAIITAERGRNSLTRHGLEEYVADCVILLDNRVTGQTATRRLQIVKYRGANHGTNEYPFLIDESGISVMPLTSTGMDFESSTERGSSGIPRLDAMMGGQGYYRGSSVLVSGTAGTGKTSVAAHFAQGTVERGGSCLWFAFEESSSQIIRNMRSVGIDLAPAVQNGNLRLHTESPTAFGLEMHLATMHKMVDEFKPTTVILDPISNFSAIGSEVEIKAMLTRLVGFFKSRQITSLFTNLVTGGTPENATEAGVSSLMDTWLLLQDIESGAERNRVLQLLKSRGMAHSSQTREFLMTDHGVELRDVYVGKSGALLTGSSLMVQRAQEEAQSIVREEQADLLKRELELKRQAVEAQIAGLQAEFEIEHTKTLRAIAQDKSRTEVLVDDRAQMAEYRQADTSDAELTTQRELGGP